METDPIKKEECMFTIRSFLAEVKELEVVNLCDTSSDEDVTLDPVPVNKTINNNSQDSKKNQRHRLPGIGEKWNSDVSDEEEDKDGDDKDGDDGDMDEDEAANDNEQNDQSSQGIRSGDDSGDNRGDTGDSDSDSGDESVADKHAIVSNTVTTATPKDNRRNPKVSDEDSQVNRSTSSQSGRAKTTPPIQNSSIYSIDSSQIKPMKKKYTRGYEEDNSTIRKNYTNSTNSSKSSQVKPLQIKDTRGYEEDNQPTRSNTTNSTNSSNSSQVKEVKRRDPRLFKEIESQPLTNAQEKEYRRKKRVISDDSQPLPTVTTKSFHFPNTAATQQKITRKIIRDTEDECETFTATTEASDDQCNVSTDGNTNEDSERVQREEESQQKFDTEETQSEAEDRILSETSADIDFYNKTLEALGIISKVADENTITEDSQLGDMGEDSCSPILKEKVKEKTSSLKVINVPRRTVTRSQETTTKSKKRVMTDAEEDAMDIYASYKRTNKKKK